MCFRLVSTGYITKDDLEQLIFPPLLPEYQDYSYIAHSLWRAKDQIQDFMSARPTVNGQLPAELKCFVVTS